MAKKQVPLADAIIDLRAQLEAAMAEGEGKALRFGLNEVVLEIALELASETGGNLGVSWIVSVGAKAGATSRTTHTVKLVLVPKSVNGEDVLLS